MFVRVSRIWVKKRVKVTTNHFHHTHHGPSWISGYATAQSSQTGMARGSVQVQQRCCEESNKMDCGFIIIIKPSVSRHILLLFYVVWAKSFPPRQKYSARRTRRGFCRQWNWIHRTPPVLLVSHGPSLTSILKIPHVARNRFPLPKKRALHTRTRASTLSHDSYCCCLCFFNPFGSCTM